MILAHAIMACARTSATLIVGFAFAGLGFGMAPILLILVVSEEFGVMHMGANYG